MALWLYGIGLRRHYGTMALWHYGNMELWLGRAKEPIEPNSAP
jgi:hypothetical protein